MVALTLLEWVTLMQTMNKWSLERVGERQSDGK